MIRFEKLRVPENFYPYAPAKAAAAYANGTMGTISTGTFTAGAGTVVLMQEEQGDKEYMDEFTVPAGADIRTADIDKAELDGVEVNITSVNLPVSFSVGDVLVADSNGVLSVGDGSATGFKVVEKTRYGARAVIVYVAA